jgi:DNA (cytosine-5)-methyltransferase 1
MRHGSLFSGIGGFDLAAEWMGWQNVFHCEWNPFGQKILHHYWPNAIQYHDITKTDFTIHRKSIDILTGGFPCQPYSNAGKRRGKNDSRHLWPEMLRAIRQIQPTWVVGENVYGIITWNDGLVFHEVQTDLETQGYEVQSYVLPSAAVNAPHRRERTFFIAYCDNGGISNQMRNKRDGKEIIQKQERNIRHEFGKIGGHAFSSNTDNNGLFSEYGENEINASKRRVYAFGDFKQGDGDGDVGYSTIEIPGWEQFPTESPICSRDDGIPTGLDGISFSKWRNESIKGFGNAVVPQVVHQIFKAIQQYEDDRK